MSSRKLQRLLEKHDARLVRQRGTSHAIYERVSEGRIYRAPVVTGKSELSPRYIRLVLRQLGFTKDEIKALFR